MRKLVHIEIIDKVAPIFNADAIEVVTILGWEVVTKKGEYQVGDKVAYCEIDSWLPHELAPFLSKGEPREYEGVKGERLRTVKLRGQVSQGLVLPLSAAQKEMDVGTDLTEVLGVIKWERPESPEERARLAGNSAGAFPSQIPKTDQERIQNVFRSIENKIKSGELIDEWFVQEKLEGSSMQVGNIEGHNVVLSRNVNLKLDQVGNAFVDAANAYGMLDYLTELREAGELPNVFSIQGELIGTGIQGNIYKLEGHQWRVFDIWNGVRYLSVPEIIEFVKKANEDGKAPMDMVPMQPAVISNLFGEGSSVKSILEMAEIKSNLLETQDAEGLVFKNFHNPNVTFKAISNRYLLKEK